MKGGKILSRTKWIKWARAAGIRALRTCAQTALALIGTSMLISDVDWLQTLSATLVAGILSILTSIVSLPEIKE